MVDGAVLGSGEHTNFLILLSIIFVESRKTIGFESNMTTLQQGIALLDILYRLLTSFKVGISKN